MQNTLPRHDRKKESTLFLNPMINKIASVTERSETAATYGGIFTKFGYFLMMMLIGVAVAVVFFQTGVISVDAVTDEFLMADYAIIMSLAALGMFAVFPFVAFLLRRTIPVTGALYSVSLGYLLGFCMTLDVTIRGYMLLALALTVAIVVTMGVLYFKGIIQVTHKLRAVATTLLFTLLSASLLLVLCSFVPAFKDGIEMLRNNFALSIGASVAGVIVAAMFLLIDFDTIKKTVDNRLPREFEWFAAFSVLFTIVWLYFKVLDLVMKLQDQNK